jgi:hypothetical protein
MELPEEERIISFMTAAQEGLLDDAEEFFTDLDNWGVIIIYDHGPTTEEKMILKSGVTVLPFDLGEYDVTFSAIFRRVDGIKYESNYNIYEYMLCYIIPQGNNTVLYYMLSKYKLRADSLDDYSWIVNFEGFELIQRDVLITQHQLVSLIPEWGKKVQIYNAKYYDLPDGSHLKSYTNSNTVDISNFVYAEIARRGQKSARS